MTCSKLLVYVFVNSTLSLSDINILLSDSVLPITKTYLLLRNPSGLEIQSVELVNVNLHYALYRKICLVFFRFFKTRKKKD